MIRIKRIAKFEHEEVDIIERLDEYAELKRMFVVPSARGMGVAKTLLSQLEAVAKKNNLKNVRLETGINQKETIGMYEKSGYQHIEPFGSLLI